MATLVQIKDGSAGIRLRIDKPQFRIGRATENEISIDDELVSKTHAVIEAMPLDERASLDYYIQDQASTNGTFVNDARVDLHKLSNGDVIRIGMSNFRFLDDTNDDPAETAQLHKTWIPGVFVTKPKKKKTTRKKTK
ncbi:MAG: FHA domain-containing protein [Gammaproteobacteria bacterium]|nr:FHA domain-containing protein [Gammaproteobacteria bacterium]